MLGLAQEHGRPTCLVKFDVDPAVCRRRNKARSRTVPAKVISAQFEKWAELRDSIGEGFDQVHGPGPARVLPASLLPTAEPGSRRMKFGLLISAFDWSDNSAAGGESSAIADRLDAIASEAEDAGFESIWVMDHFMQIPQVGREWDPMLEAYSTLAYLAARTDRVGLGALVSCITHRNLGLLGKTIATLDVLSQGRARCGLGLGWFKREHHAFGYEFADNDERYALLEDALQFLPQQWGPGAPAFEGPSFSTPEAFGYPRPLQEHVPLLVGGSGEKRTLRLAARYADACNLFGEPDAISHKVSVLHEHCVAAGRDPADLEVTQLSNVLVAANDGDLRSRTSELNHGLTPEQFAQRTNAATVDEHCDRFARLADAGVDMVMVWRGDRSVPCLGRASQNLVGRRCDVDHRQCVSSLTEFAEAMGDTQSPVTPAPPSAHEEVGPPCHI